MNQVENNKTENSENSGASVSLTVEGDLNYTPNDIAELRKLADSHPDLAKQIASDRRDGHIISQNTERLGMTLAVLLGLALIGGTSWTLISLGWWQSIMFVAALLGISHILRTVLKGEFSDTSWFISMLSRTPTSDPSEESDSEPK